jgi:membrane protease YdiL (CAAX protease family)
MTGNIIPTNDVISPHDQRAPSPASRAWLALLLLVPVPSIAVIVAMYLPATAGTPLGQAVYMAGKVWLVALPAIWWLWVERGRVSWSPMRAGGLGVGAALGVVIAGAIVGAYWLFGRAMIDPQQVRDAAKASGIDQPGRYIVLAVYLCTFNAVLEEYVWRWFVYRKCEQIVRIGWLAVLLSAVFFTAHHVLALGAQFDWRITLMGSIGVFIGGAVWSWCYLRYRSIWPGLLSHVIVDIAIVAIGWHLIFGE